VNIASELSGEETSDLAISVEMKEVIGLSATEITIVTAIDVEVPNEKIRMIHTQSRQTYGYQRVTAKLTKVRVKRLAAIVLHDSFATMATVV
jgi:hypothetical protein